MVQCRFGQREIFCVFDDFGHTFEADEVIFLEGETRSSLWIIEDGSVKISKLNPEGAEYILHLL